MNDQPSPAESNGHSGRDNSGRFTPGNRFGRGNPLAAKAQRLRVAMLETVDPKDIEEIVAAVVASAKAGDIQAATFVLDRTIGKPTHTDVLQRIETLEQIIGSRRP
jgi:hypothetical protein